MVRADTPLRIRSVRIEGTCVRCVAVCAALCAVRFEATARHTRSCGFLVN